MGRKGLEAISVKISTGNNKDEVELRGAMTVQRDEKKGQPSFSITIQFEKSQGDEKSMTILLPSEQATELLRYLEEQA